MLNYDDDDNNDMFKCEHERERETYVKKNIRGIPIEARNNW